MHVAGEPQGRGAWRGAVAEAAWPLTLARADIDPRTSPRAVGHSPATGVLEPGPSQLRMDFVVTHWVDLDTLLQTTLAGLRDAGWYGRGLSGLHAVLATKSAEGRPGVTIEGIAVTGLDPPGPVALDLAHDVVPRDRAAARAWQGALAREWGERPLLDAGESWIDVAVDARVSPLGALERILDALEPVMGRDPRGRTEMFPNDHLATWLRVRRSAAGDPPLRLRLGPRP